MSTCNTSFNAIIEDQISKLSNVQSTFKLILDTKHELEVKDELKLKYDEIHDFINKLKSLKDALNDQLDLCNEIKKISSTINPLVQQITNMNDDSTVLPPSKDNTTNSSSNESPLYYSPVDNNVYSETEIAPIRPKILEFRTFEIMPLTAEEFTIIPKYMLRRITLEGLNRFVDLFNTTLQIKYTLLAKPKASLKGSERQQYRDYKDQETVDTKGKYFVTELDIARQQNKKNLEKSTYNLLVILRHMKRLYENRTGHLLKFIIH